MGEIYFFCCLKAVSWLQNRFLCFSSFVIWPLTELFQNSSDYCLLPVLLLLNPTLWEPPWTTACQASLSFSLSEFAQTLVHWISDAIQPSHPLLPPSRPPLNLFQDLVFSIELALQIRASASASVLPMNIQGWFPLGLTGLISLLSKGLSRDFQHHNSKASILWCSVLFMVHPSRQYMTNGKTIALTIWTFVGKVMFLLFKTLSRFVIAFLSRSKYLLISWLQSPYYKNICVLLLSNQNI